MSRSTFQPGIELSSSINLIQGSIHGRFESGKVWQINFERARLRFSNYFSPGWATRYPARNKPIERSTKSPSHRRNLPLRSNESHGFGKSFSRRRRCVEYFSIHLFPSPGDSRPELWQPSHAIPSPVTIERSIGFFWTIIYNSYHQD